jgi:hypothetical protein
LPVYLNFNALAIDDFHLGEEGLEHHASLLARVHNDRVDFALDLDDTVLTAVDVDGLK